MKIIQKEYNIQTGQEIITERDETSVEKKVREAAEKEIAVQLAQAEAKAASKTALLERLGISEAEAKLLLA